MTTRWFSVRWLALLGSLLLLCLPALAANTTVTTITVNRSNTETVPVITLTAAVGSAGVPVTVGEVRFCNASAAYCEDSALLGTVWMTQSGTATLRRALPVGTTNVRAVFQGTNSYPPSSSHITSVTVSGLGSVSATQSFATGQSITKSLVSGDFNNDGYPDLLAIEDTGSIALFLGRGNGTFVAGPEPSFNGSNGSWATGDFDRDGTLDLVGGTPLRIFKGNGDGTFTPGQVLPVIDAGNIKDTLVVVGDFNGDGRADIAVLSGNTSSRYANSIQVFLGNGDGTFTSGPMSVFGETGEAAIGVAQIRFGGAGHLGLIVGTSLASGGGNTRIMEGDGAGAFTLMQTISVGSSYYAVGDFNGDGNLDFAMNGGSGIRVELGTAAALFTEGEAMSGFAYGPLVATDLNGDGFTDLAWDAGETPASLVAVFGDGTGTFGAAQNYNAPYSTYDYALALGDFFSLGQSAVAISSGSPSYVTLQPFNDSSQLGAGSVNISGLPLTTQARPQFSAVPDIRLNPMALNLPAAGYISTVAGNGTNGMGGTSGLATAATLGMLRNVAVDGSGNLYIANSQYAWIHKVTASTNNISTVAGNGTNGYNGDGIAAVAAELSSPNGVAVDAAGNIYIGDSLGARIRKVTIATGLISTVAGTGTAGFSGDGSAATAAKINQPSGLAIDASGNIYFADTTNSRIRKVTVSTGKISTVAGGGAGGDGGLATAASLSQPSGVALDAAGNIYIADTYDSRIRKVTISTGVISTVAGTGAAGYNGDGIAATAAEIWSPSGVALDVAGNIYIYDSFNSRIRKVTISTGLISTVAGTGTNGYNGDGIAAKVAKIQGAGNVQNDGVAVDGSGNLYISDGYRVRGVTPGLAASSVSVSCSPSSTVFGGNTTTTCTAQTTPGVTPTGTMTFTYNGGTGWTSGAINASGSFSASGFGGFAAGSYTILATYSGDSNYSGSSASTTYVINPPALPTPTVTASFVGPSTVAYGQSTSVNVQVSCNSACGNVDYRLDGGEWGTVPLSSSGSFLAGTGTTWAPGVHSIVVAYLGNSSYNPANSNTLSLTILPPTITGITSSSNPSPYGEVLTLSALVNTGGGTPTGTVTFYDGATSIGTGSVSLVSTTNLLSNSNNFSSYWPNQGVTLTAGAGIAPDGTNSATLMQRAGGYYIDEVVPCSPGPNTWSIWTQQYSGTPITYTFSYRAYDGDGTSLPFGSGWPTFSTSGSWARQSFTETVPTGAVSCWFGIEISTASAGQGMYIWGAQLEAGSSAGPYVLSGPTATSGSGGIATLAYSGLKAGSHSITAVYGGDANELASTSAALSQVVTPAPLMVTANNATRAFDAANPAFTATYTGFVNGDTTASLTGAPSLTTTAVLLSPVAGNPYPITAAIGTLVDGNYTFSFTNGTLTITKVVLVPNTTFSLVSAPNPSTYGSAVTFTATAPPLATETVQFYANGVAMGSPVVVSGGVAAYTTSTLPVGTQTITAQYSGDTNYAGVTSSPLSQVVNKGSVTFAVSSSVNPSIYSSPATLTINCTGSASGVTPIGTLTISDSLGGWTQQTISLVAGVGTLTTSSLPVGTNTLTIVYNGDANYQIVRGTPGIGL